MQSRDYGPDVLASFSGRPAVAPEIAAEIDLVVECASTGFCGAVVRIGRDHVEPRGPQGDASLVRADAVGVPARGTAGHAGARQARRRARAGPVGVRVDRRTRRPRARWPGPAASTSRAGTTPSWSRRCGATTCAIEGVVVEYLEGVDELPATSLSSAPARDAGSACSWTTSCPARRRCAHRRAGRGPARARRRAPVHGRLAGGASRPRSGSRRGRRSHPASRGRRGAAPPSAGRTRPGGRAGAGSGSSRCERTPTSSRAAGPGRGADRLRHRRRRLSPMRWSVPIRSRTTASASSRPAQGQHGRPCRSGVDVEQAVGDEPRRRRRPGVVEHGRSGSPSASRSPA